MTLSVFKEAFKKSSVDVSKPLRPDVTYAPHQLVVKPNGNLKIIDVDTTTVLTNNDLNPPLLTEQKIQSNIEMLTMNLV